MPDAVPFYVHLRRAKDLIDSAYAEDLDVEDLAREAHASPAHFIRSFKRTFGETPHKYLQRRAATSSRARHGAPARNGSVGDDDQPRGRLSEPGFLQLDVQGADRRGADRVRAALAGRPAATHSGLLHTYEALRERGVQFLSEPSERSYGIEATLRDNSGNWFSMTQPLTAAE